MMWNFLIIYIGVMTNLMIWSKIKVFIAETYYLPFLFIYLMWFVVVKMKFLNRFGKIDKKSIN